MANRPGLILSNAEGQSIVNVINIGRRNTIPSAADLPLLKWDTELALDLKNFAATVDPAWFFAVNTNNNKNGQVLMASPSFAAKYPNYKYMISDAAQSKLPHGILGIINFRLNQKPCFNYNNCSTKAFNGFSTCYSNPMPQGKNCNWVMQYYPYLTQNNMSKIACVPLDAHGPAAPAAQDMSFFCYGRFKDTHTGLENTDRQYLSGPACSKCPPEAPVCNNGLCAPETPKSLKM